MEHLEKIFKRFEILLKTLELSLEQKTYYKKKEPLYGAW